MRRYAFLGNKLTVLTMIYSLFCHRLDVFEFLAHVQDGLKDHYDIKMLTYLMVAR